MCSPVERSRTVPVGVAALHPPAMTEATSVDLERSYPLPQQAFQGAALCVAVALAPVLPLTATHVLPWLLLLPRALWLNVGEGEFWTLLGEGLLSVLLAAAAGAAVVTAAAHAATQYLRPRREGAQRGDLERHLKGIAAAQAGSAACWLLLTILQDSVASAAAWYGGAGQGEAMRMAMLGRRGCAWALCPGGWWSWLLSVGTLQQPLRTFAWLAGPCTSGNAVVDAVLTVLSACLIAAAVGLSVRHLQQAQRQAREDAAWEMVARHAGSIDAADPVGQSPMSKGSTTRLRLAADAVRYARTEGLRSPLHCRIVLEDPALVKRITVMMEDEECIWKLQATDQRQRTALDLALEYGCPAGAMVLIESGARCGRLKSPLHSPALIADTRLVRACIDRGWDVSEVDASGRTPLMIAVESRSPRFETHQVQPMLQKRSAHDCATPRTACSRHGPFGSPSPTPVYQAIRPPTPTLPSAHRADTQLSDVSCVYLDFDQTAQETEMVVLQSDCTESAKLLINHGAKVYRAGKLTSPLHSPAILAEPELVQECLKTGLWRCDETGPDNKRPLALALAGRHAEAAKLLVEAGAEEHSEDSPHAGAVEVGLLREMSRTDFTRSPLHLPSVLQNPRLVARLLAEGWDTNALDGKERTPLMLALDKFYASRPHPAASPPERRSSLDGPLSSRTAPVAAPDAAAVLEVVRELVEHGGRVFVGGKLSAPLFSEQVLADEELVALCIRCGCPLHERDHLGRLPISIAAAHGMTGALQRLLPQGKWGLPAEEPGSDAAWETQTWADVVRCAGIHNSAQVAQVESAVARARSEGLCSPLHVREVLQEEQLTLYFLEKGWPVEDEWGDTLLHHCAAAGWADILQWLLERELRCGGTADPTNQGGCTPLMAALSRGNADCAMALLEAGASARGVDRSGWTTLHHAALGLGSDQDTESRALMHDVIDQLLEAGADPAVKESDGKTAADVAVLSGDTQLAARIALWLRSPPGRAYRRGGDAVTPPSLRDRLPPAAPPPFPPAPAAQPGPVV
eukprot:TRINITY_DN8428_c3_g1_i2.p1 TRINITY_DN8428_c3_g1~~TRINITY_DN8428_c3_g1_i2.p1  ORF type:complete len:1029 (+),score=248.03 TRINITY_DN8428_c3_g1_i2:727-3813(+)